MANTKSAKKQARQNQVKRLRNMSRLTAIKTAMKKVLNAIENKEDVDKTKELLSQAAAKLGRARGKGTLHRNTAARKLSRLARRVHLYTSSQQKEANK